MQEENRRVNEWKHLRRGNSAASAPGEAERAGIAQKARQGIPRDSGGVSPRNDES
ncbi:MAG TPA: hypothetical protein VFL96_04020 [Acidobacteriaceae bacterium]|nr:hypothetical protein [Acidobacteriaceae bacterium]